MYYEYFNIIKERPFSVLKHFYSRDYMSSLFSNIIKEYKKHLFHMRITFS